MYLSMEMEIELFSFVVVKVCVHVDFLHFDVTN